MGSSTNEEKIAVLINRVNRLDNIVWVVTIVAAIFGISGAFGYRALSETQKQLEQARLDVGILDQKIQDAQRRADSAPKIFESAIKDMAHEAVGKDSNQRLNAMETWIKYTYCQAHSNKITMIGPNNLASGVWEQSLAGKFPDITEDKPIDFKLADCM